MQFSPVFCAMRQTQAIQSQKRKGHVLASTVKCLWGLFLTGISSQTEMPTSLGLMKEAWSTP